MSATIDLARWRNTSVSSADGICSAFMVIERVFLGHERPALLSAADLLLTRHAAGSLADLRKVLVVVPGSRAGRRLLEVLVEVARTRELCLTPPTIVTVGTLPEHLYRPKRPFASELVQRLVWAETLSNAAPELLARVIPRPPSQDDRTRWLAYGDLLRRQHVELAADGLDFEDVVERGATLEGFTEQPRWRALQQLQQNYLDRLDALELWDIQTARLKAVEFQECRTDREIVLVGAVDLNVTLRQMLDQVADRVTALIFAPTDWDSRFDQQGCLIPSAWEQIELPIATAQVEVVEGPADQAEEVVRQLSSLAGRYRADEIVIGVPDEKLIPDLERRLALDGVTARWGPGESFGGTSPIRLLDAVASFLEHERYAEFAALVRHPDVGQWLARAHVASDWLERLDEYQNRHLPFRLSDELLGSSRNQDSWRQVGEAVRRLLGDLTHSAQSLNAWANPVWRLLTNVYGQRTLHSEVPADRVIYGVCERVREALVEQSRIPVAVMPQVSASQAIRWLLDEVRSATIPATMTTDSVEMLGWLELPLDDAPVLLVTSFNEGFVPESLNSDLFMPNALRQRLGLLDNARRYARDAYAVSVLVAARNFVQWIVGRRNHDGDPLAPSRLLFACDAETTAQRAQQFFQPREDRGRFRQDAARPSDPRRLEIPRPKPLATPITRLRVTAFCDYITCPYRFYLRHVERLEAVSDSLDELDGRGFGSLAHEVLRRFGSGPRRDSTDANAVRAALEQELDHCAADAFGRNPLPAVLVQVEQLRWRLRAFAEKQAAWSDQGWRIEFVETSAVGELGAQFDVDGEPFWLTGRIDRIDVHRTTGERVIFDYKTSDAGQSPKQTHQCRDGWIDLQLPLYRHLAVALGIVGPVKLGYIVLPKDTKATGFVIADWNSEELAVADEYAREVVRNIRCQRFFPPADPPPGFADEFGPICQDGVLDR